MKNNLLANDNLLALTDVDAGRETLEGVGNALTTEVIDGCILGLFDRETLHVGGDIVRLEDQAIGRSTHGRGLTEIALEAREVGLRPRIESDLLLALSRLESEDRTAGTDRGGDLCSAMSDDSGGR